MDSAGGWSTVRLGRRNVPLSNLGRLSPPLSSFFLFCRMPAPELEGKFDDAIDKLTEDFQQQHNYIDDTPPEHSDDTSEGDDDSDSEEPDDDFARVEDEDWEITERGGCSNPTLQNFSNFDSPS
jgi:hypothetical protein